MKCGFFLGLSVPKNWKKFLMPLLVKEPLPYKFCAVCKPNFSKTNQEEERRKANWKKKKMMKKTNFVLYIYTCGRNWRVGKCRQLAVMGRLEDLEVDGKIILKRSWFIWGVRQWIRFSERRICDHWWSVARTDWTFGLHEVREICD